MRCLRSLAAALALLPLLAANAGAPLARWAQWRPATHRFLYAAAFFYERTPRGQWGTDLRAYKAMGINTIDLYVPWNFQEPHAGELDFSGKTNPRRDLRGLLATIVRDGLGIILRPGPVIRNEWRNGGYPAWLLRRRAYNMPLHDILQGRYPATATLQNAHADAAAREWLRNPAHLRAVRQWYHDVFSAVAPWASHVRAIALDDDQGAYIDNDTWPAPYWHAYIRWLKESVRREVGPEVPLFINTYQTKVPAATGSWDWGNWYQSDAYRIGTHDLAQLIFSTALLQTQPQHEVMQSEFQAGWLQGADEIRPRAAAPENTTIALHQLLQLGAHGIVNFPVQDTMNPAGWEAPWANALYAWDAALSIGALRQARYQPTAAFGALVHRAGARWLARLRPDATLAIAWPVSAYASATMTNPRIGAFAAATLQAFMACRRLKITCRAIDLRFASSGTLARYRAIFIPRNASIHSMLPGVRRRLRQYAGRGRIVRHVSTSLRDGIASTNGSLRDATLLTSPHERSALYDVFNIQTRARSVPTIRLRLAGAGLTLPPMQLAAGSACDWRIDRGARARLRVAWRLCTTPLSAAAPMNADSSLNALVAALRSDGTPTFTLENKRIRLIVSADAGARSFLLEDRAIHRNLATSIGLFRDDVKSPPSPSPRDYIAKFTHPFEAGTFNRPYRCISRSSPSAEVLRCSITVDDLAQTPVTFVKTFVLDPTRARLRVLLSASAPARSIDAFAQGSKLLVTTHGGRLHWVRDRRGYRLLRLTYSSQAELDLSLPGAQ